MCSLVAGPGPSTHERSREPIKCVVYSFREAPLTPEVLQSSSPSEYLARKLSYWKLRQWAACTKQRATSGGLGGAGQGALLAHLGPAAAHSCGASRLRSPNSLLTCLSLVELPKSGTGGAELGLSQGGGKQGGAGERVGIAEAGWKRKNEERKVWKGWKSVPEAARRLRRLILGEAKSLLPLCPRPPSPLARPTRDTHASQHAPTSQNLRCSNLPHSGVPRGRPRVPPADVSGGRADVAGSPGQGLAPLRQPVAVSITARTTCRS